MTIEELSPGADASSLDVADNLKLAASASEIVLYSSAATESEEAFSPKQYKYETEGSYGESPASDATEDLATGIPEFFKGRSVLVTGATGFLGKVLVEKLLRSCPEVSTIYLILRAKRGRSVKERLATLLESKAFDRIRDDKSLEKIVAVEGDVSASGLALSSDDIRILTSRVSVIFHCAATVRFQEPLRDAVLLNVRGSREVARLALRMPHLQALVHVSTAYSNCDRNLIEELVYPPPADYNVVIEYAEKLDEKTLESIAPKLLKSLPNTYIFSKSLAEHVMYSFKGVLPIAICRPSVVSPSYCEPYPGWVDSFYGPMGVLIGASLGILRSIQGNGDVKTDILPVDFGINALIAIAWDTAMNKNRGISVYNCTTGSEMPVTWNKFLKEGEKQYKKYPSTKMLWYPGGAMYKSYIVYLVYFLFFQMIPAILLDTVLYIRGKKTRFIKLQKKIFNSGSTLNYFLLKEWNFTNNNVKRISATLNKNDKSNFNFDASTINFCEYVEHWAVGSRRFMMKLDDSSIPEAKQALKRLYWADCAVKISFGLLLVAIIFLF